MNCEQAVRNIKQQCGRKKNRIETKANNAINLKRYSVVSSFVDYFVNECYVFLDEISKKNSAENLSNYLLFLDRVEKGKEWLNNGNDK